MSRDRRGDGTADLQLNVDDDEFCELLEWTAYDILGHTGPINDSDRARKLRELLNDSRIAAETEHLWPLESAWRQLNSVSRDESGLPGLDRDSLVHKRPLEQMMTFVMSGSYPPPEVLWLVVTCINRYYLSDGNISLDEAFFEEPHKKHSSDAFLQRKNHLYSYFEEDVSRARTSSMNEGEARPSLEEVAEDFLEHAIAFDEIDVDSFLRGYRRWRRSRCNVSNDP